MHSLLFKTTVPCADGIEFHIRTIGEIMEYGEENYFHAISLFTADPWDYMYPLAQAGVDFETTTEFELFISLLSELTPEAVEFLFGDTLSFKDAKLARNEESGQIVLVTPNSKNEEFNAASLRVIADVIRRVHYFTHEVRKVGNQAAKKYLLRLAEKKAKRNKNKPVKPVLEPLVIAFVNAPEFPYDYQSVKQVSIYQFFSSVQQIPRRLQWNFTMHGIHVGMIDASKLNPNELNWMTPSDTTLEREP